MEKKATKAAQCDRATITHGPTRMEGKGEENRKLGRGRKRGLGEGEKGEESRSNFGHPDKKRAKADGGNECNKKSPEWKQKCLNPKCDKIHS